MRLLEPREVPLGGPRAMTVRRTLPHKEIRTIGAWCFVDDYGPDDVAVSGGMDVPPHPHTGLQTVSWLVRGEVLHQDSLGSVATVRPGQLNLMTAGRGIAHSEQSVGVADGGDGVLHGVQLWVALPDGARFGEPRFDHHADLPVGRLDGAEVTVLMGRLAGLASPAATFSPLVGAQVRLPAGERVRLPLDPTFEHGLLALDGSARLGSARLGGAAPEGTAVGRGPLVHLEPGPDRLDVEAGEDGALLLLVGGEPLHEDLLMWWNFVGRSHEEIVRFRQDWEDGRGFGDVPGYPGAPLHAPALPTTPLRPRPSRR